MGTNWKEDLGKRRGKQSESVERHYLRGARIAREERRTKTREEEKIGIRSEHFALATQEGDTWEKKEDSRRGKYSS